MRIKINLNIVDLKVRKSKFEDFLKLIKKRLQKYISVKYCTNNKIMLFAETKKI